MTPSPEDFLSDTEAEVMDRARDPQCWESIDWFERQPGNGLSKGRHTRLAAIRRAWAARPSTARECDRQAAILLNSLPVESKGALAIGIHSALYERGMSLLTGAPSNG